MANLCLHGHRETPWSGLWVQGNAAALEVPDNDIQMAASHKTGEKRQLWHEECRTHIHSRSLSIETKVRQLGIPQGSRRKQEMWQNHKTQERKAKAVKDMTESAVGQKQLHSSYKPKKKVWKTAIREHRRKQREDPGQRTLKNPTNI